MDVDEYSVVIAGGGPTGLMLAAELALANVGVVIVERRLTQEVDGSRAGGLHSRTIEVLDQRGVADRFVSEGQTYPFIGYSLIQLDISDFPTRHNYVLGLWQSRIEPILADWVLGDLGVPILRGREVVGVAQDADGVDVALSDGSALRAGYLAGCDGGRSLVRKAAGIDFVGSDPSTSWMIAEVEMAVEPELGIRYTKAGMQALGRRLPEEPVRAVLTEATPDHDGEPSLDDLRAALIEVWGTDFGVHSPTWISRFTDMTRQAASYRSGRVLLAGDAAHVHPPQGGQGLNTGVQDAMNLGWKLAMVVKGDAPESLLDTYHDERHPVGARVLQNTKAQVALGSPDERHVALREQVTELLSFDGPRRSIVGMISGLDVHYDAGSAHPLVGRRMPDLDIEIEGDVVAVYSLLHAARPVLISFGAPGQVAVAGDGASAGAKATFAPWSDRLSVVEATYNGPWDLPVIGAVSAPSAVLIRPDGYVAWVGELAEPSLVDALTTWFGPAAKLA